MARLVPVSDQREVAKAGRLIPAYVLSLEIENFRCFREKQTLSLTNHAGLPAQWTVILGDNGTGKTTLLETIAALYPFSSGSAEVNEEGEKKDRVQVSLSTMSSEPRRAGITYFEDLKSMAASNCRLHMKLHAGPIDTRAQQNLETTLRPAIIRSFDEFLKAEEERKRLQMMTVSVSGSGGSSVSLIQTFESSGWFANPYFPLVAAFGAHRIGQVASSTSLSDSGAQDPTASLFSEDARLRNAEEWLLQVDYASRIDSPVKQASVHRLSLVKDALVRILPEVQDIEVVAPSQDQPRPTVQFHTRFGALSLRQLSLGYKTMISWLVDLASRMMDHYPLSDDFLQQPALVLVDEIDLHMHPRWQRQIMILLSELFPKAQFVVTSHSPLIVQSLADPNTAVLVANGDHVEIRNDPESVKGWRVDQILTSDLFGLASSRSPMVERLLHRRREIMTKPKLTREDRAELTEIDKQLGPLQSGETAIDMEAMNIIRRAAQRLSDEN